MTNTFTSAKKTLVTDPLNTGAQTAIDLYTVSSGMKSIVFALSIANKNSNTEFSVDIAIDDGSIKYLGQNLPVPYGSTLIWDKPITLLATERLKLRANSGSNVDAVASILEIT